MVGEWSHLFRKIASGTHLIRGWVAPRARLDVSEKQLSIYVGQQVM